MHRRPWEMLWAGGLQLSELLDKRYNLVDNGLFLIACIVPPANLQGTASREESHFKC